MLRSLKQFIEDILIFRGVFKGPTLGPLGKHKCQGPVQLCPVLKKKTDNINWGAGMEAHTRSHMIAVT